MNRGMEFALAEESQGMFSFAKLPYVVNYNVRWRWKEALLIYFFNLLLLLVTDKDL